LVSGLRPGSVCVARRSHPALIWHYHFGNPVDHASSRTLDEQIATPYSEPPCELPPYAEPACVQNENFAFSPVSSRSHSNALL